MPSSTSLTSNPSFRWLRRTERQGPNVPPTREVVLRLSRGDDHTGLERLAELESRPLPRGGLSDPAVERSRSGSFGGRWSVLSV